MADEQPSERDINIQSTVNVGTATDQTNVSGLKLSVGSAREVNIHSDAAPPPSFRSVALVGVLAFLGAVLVNIATSQLPPSLQSPLWLSWLLVLLVTALSIWVAYRQSRSTRGSFTLRGSLEQRNRRAMLAKVKAIWIDGLLEQSLTKETYIALELTEKPDVLDLPLNAIVQELNHPPRPLKGGTPIIDVFDKMGGMLGGTLLILGAPGAGKTTLLLELARDLLTRARQDEIQIQPIPVVFSLSSWAAKPQLFSDWLIQELNTKYEVPRKLAQAWI